MRIKVFFHAYLVLIGLVFVVGALPSDAQTKTLIAFNPTTFKSNAGETLPAELGWLTVPERHGQTGKSLIRLPVMRFKSTAAQPGSPIIYIAGGPGGSGLASAKGAIFPYIKALRERADVIVYDQRGTGDAQPSLVVQGRFDLPDKLLSDPAVRTQFLGKVRDAVAEIRSRGIDLSAYNTVESAADLDDLRAGLGADKITLWGHSYGSHLGLAYIKRYEAFVDRAILGGINGPDQRWRYPQDLEQLIDRVDERMAAIPKLHRQMPSLKKTIRNVLEKLAEKPVTVDLNGRPVTIGRQEVEILVALQSGENEFVKNLPQFFGWMEKGNFTFAAQMVQAGLRAREIGTAMRYSMHIASGLSPARRAVIEKQRATSLFGNAINFPFDDPEFLESWQVADLGDDFRAPVKSDIPTFFMSGTLDGRTSIADADAIRKGFPHSRQLIIDGASHDFYGMSDKILSAMLSFLDGKDVPQKLVVPFEIRSPKEREIVLELRKLIMTKGLDAGLSRLRELASPKSDVYITSYVIGTLAIIILNDDKMPKESQAILEAGVRIFPDNEFLIERLADAYRSAGQKEAALALYRKCLELNGVNQSAALRVKELSQN